MEIDSVLAHLQDGDNEVTIEVVCSVLDELAEYVSELCDLAAQKGIEEMSGSQYGRVGFSVDNLRETIDVLASVIINVEEF